MLMKPDEAVAPGSQPYGIQPTSLPWGSLIRSMLCTKWSSFSTLCTSNDVYPHASEQLSSHLGSCQSATHVQKLVDGSIEMQHRQRTQTFCSQQTHQMLRLRDTSIKSTRQGVVFFYGSILQYHTIVGHLPAIFILELYQQHPRSPHSVAGCRNLHPAEARPSPPAISPVDPFCPATMAISGP